MKTQRRPAPISHASLGLALLACSGMLVSCSSPPKRTEQQIRSTQNIADPIRTLEARAELENLNPLPPADDTLIRRLLRDTTDVLTPGTEAYRRALLRPDEIELPRVPALSSTPPTPEAIDPIRRGHATKIYTRVRTLRQAGQSEQALEGLQRAIELDPTSTKLHRTLGETYAELGDSINAEQAYTRAIELGDRSPTTLVSLASSAYARNDYERVMALCTIALAQESNDAPVARTLAGVMLGNAQIRLGYLRAGAESLGDALESFSPDLRDPRWRQQLIQIQGRRPALWVMVGDAWSRVGSHARAAGAYARAAELSGSGTGGLTSRRIAEHLREGHPATGALLLIDHVLRYANDLSPQEGEWVEVLATLPSLRGTLNDAIGSIRMQQPLYDTQTRRMLMGLEVRGLTPGQALARMGASGDDARNADAIARALLPLGGVDEQLDAAIDLVAQNPSCALEAGDALLKLPHRPVDLLRTLSSEHEDAVLLTAALVQRMGRPDLMPLRSLGSDLASSPNALLGVLSSVSASRGEWALADEISAELDRRADSGDVDAQRWGVPSAISMQDPRRALGFAQALSDQGAPTSDDLLLRARLASVTGDASMTKESLERAAALVPSDTRVAERLVRLHGVGGAMADEDAMREVIRRISEASPRSAFFAQLRASDLARGGLLSEAESLLLQLNEQRPGDIVGDDLLLSIWKTQETQGDPDALSRGQGWLSVRLSEYPGAVRAGIARAQIAYERDETETAIELLNDLSIATASMDAARAHEQLLREEGRTEEALELGGRRLGMNGGIDPAIELAQIVAQLGDAETIARDTALLADAIPSRAELYPGQVQQLAQVIYTLAERSETIDVDASMLRVVDLIEARTGGLNFYMARTKLLLESRKPAAALDLDELIGMMGRYASGIDDQAQRQQLEALPVQVLLGEDRGHEAIALLTRLALGNGELRPDQIIQTFQLLGAVGVSSDLLGVLDALDEAGAMERVIEITTNRLGTPERPSEDLTNDEQRADLAYTAGAMAAAFDRQQQSESYMRLSISFDENHGWSNNDLGYLLLERGEQIEDASAMLETAAAALPDQPNVIDSLGWLRYKQGLFEDQVDEMTGQVMRRGAISLLARANRLDTERTNATILLHLGDAFWRAGQNARAIEAWVGGENMLRSRLRLLNAQPRESRNQRAIDALSEELRVLRFRVQDAEAGAEPDVAPIFGDNEDG